VCWGIRWGEGETKETSLYHLMVPCCGKIEKQLTFSHSLSLSLSDNA